MLRWCGRQNAMLTRIKALLLAEQSSESAAKGDHGADDLQLAAAALLIEAASMDGRVDHEELSTIASLLEASFDLDAAELEDLLEAGRKAAAESSQLYGFTRVIKDRYSHDERIRMIEMLWEVAYADGHLHHYESNLVRRVTGLIHVSDRDSGEAHKRVRQRLDLPPS